MSFGKHGPTTYLKMVLVLAKLRMGPRTMSMPRSSEALSWKGTVWIRIPSSQSTPSHYPIPLSHPVPAHLQHHGAELPFLVQLPGTGQDGGCLPGAGWPIEEQMWEPVLADEALHCGITTG